MDREEKSQNVETPKSQNGVEAAAEQPSPRPSPQGEGVDGKEKAHASTREYLSNRDGVAEVKSVKEKGKSEVAEAPKNKNAVKKTGKSDLAERGERSRNVTPAAAPKPSPQPSPQGEGDDPEYLDNAGAGGDERKPGSSNDDDPALDLPGNTEGGEEDGQGESLSSPEEGQPEEFEPSLVKAAVKLGFTEDEIGDFRDEHALRRAVAAADRVAMKQAAKLFETDEEVKSQNSKGKSQNGESPHPGPLPTGEGEVEEDSLEARRAARLAKRKIEEEIEDIRDRFGDEAADKFEEKQIEIEKLRKQVARKDGANGNSPHPPPLPKGEGGQPAANGNGGGNGELTAEQAKTIKTAVETWIDQRDYAEVFGDAEKDFQQAENRGFFDARKRLVVGMMQLAKSIQVGGGEVPPIGELMDRVMYAEFPDKVKKKVREQERQRIADDLDKRASQSQLRPNSRKGGVVVEPKAKAEGHARDYLEKRGR